MSMYVHVCGALVQPNAHYTHERTVLERSKNSCTSPASPESEWMSHLSSKNTKARR